MNPCPKCKQREARPMTGVCDICLADAEQRRKLEDELEVRVPSSLFARNDPQEEA